MREPESPELLDQHGDWLLSLSRLARSPFGVSRQAISVKLLLPWLQLLVVPQLRSVPSSGFHKENNLAVDFTCSADSPTTGLGLLTSVV